MTTFSAPYNRLLGALPAEELREIAGHFITRTLAHHEQLYGRGDALDAVFFPHSGLCSKSITMADGKTAEVGLVGPEGLIGHLAAFGAMESTCDVVAQIGPVTGEMMPRRAFLEEMRRGRALTALVSRYAVAASVAASSTAACNALHTAKARAARWLLLAADRMGPRFELSHEFLATMLGVRRPTATLVAGEFKRMGAIVYTRGRIQITNRAALERCVCECYGVIAAVHAAPASSSDRMRTASRGAWPPVSLLK